MRELLPKSVCLSPDLHRPLPIYSEGTGNIEGAVTGAQNPAMSKYSSFERCTGRTYLVLCNHPLKGPGVELSQNSPKPRWITR